MLLIATVWALYKYTGQYGEVFIICNEWLLHEHVVGKNLFLKEWCGTLQASVPFLRESD